MTKKIGFILAAIFYGVLFIAYVKEPLLETLEGVPGALASLLFYLVLMPTFILLGMSAGVKIAEQEPKKSTNIFWAKRLWSGDVALPTAFLGYNLLGTIFVTLSAQFLYASLADASFDQKLLWGLIFTIFGLGYHVISIVGTWRSTRQWGGANPWISIAKYGVILSSIFLLSGLIVTGAGINIFLGN